MGWFIIFIFLIICLFTYSPWLGSAVLIAMVAVIVYGAKVSSSSPASNSAVPNVDAMTGIQYEHFVAEILKKKGFIDVRVTPPSGDFGADIIARDTNGVWICVQCKRVKGAVGIQAVQEVLGAKQYYGCQCAVVITTSRFTPAAIELARRAGVVLYPNFRGQSAKND